MYETFTSLQGKGMLTNFCDPSLPPGASSVLTDENSYSASGSALFKYCSEVTCKWKYDNPEDTLSCSAPGISIGGSKPPCVLNEEIKK